MALRDVGSGRSWRYCFAELCSVLVYGERFGHGLRDGKSDRHLALGKEGVHPDSNCSKIMIDWALGQNSWSLNR